MNDLNNVPQLVPYGKGQVSFDLSKGMKVSVIRPAPVSPAEDELQEVERALDHPIGTSKLEEIDPRNKVAVVISDLTRSVPQGRILPSIIKRLDACGVPRSSVRIFVASGQHPRVPGNQIHRLVDPEWAQGIEIISHDPQTDLHYAGKTSRGTPMWINRSFWDCDVKILTGMIDPHQFVGFTGGSKMAVIGLGGIQTIEANHSMLTHPEARLGEIEGNPVREDMDEMGRLLNIDFIINVVLNEENRIIRAFAGHYLEAWREGVRLCKALSGTPLDERLDLVIASPGGYPKDIDLYQVQKGLAHAVRALKPGGRVILAGECSEGIGDDVFQRIMENVKSPQEVIAMFQSGGFKMGLHKAFLLCRSLVEHQVYFYSGLSSSTVTKFFLTPIASIQEGISKALTHLPPNPRVGIMPKASSTFVIP